MTHPPLPVERPLLDPAPEYAKWREEGIRRVTIWGDNCPWLITRHADARAVLADPRFSADFTAAGFPGLHPQAPPRTPGMIFWLDAPDHTRLRRALVPEFTPRRVEALRDTIQRLCDELLDTMTADSRAADLVRSYTLPLPSLLIGRLLGVPADGTGLFQQFAKAVVDMTLSLPERIASRRALNDYLTDLFAARTRTPADDLLSRLATDHVAPGHLTAAEAVGLASTLLVAGHETTTHMLSLSVVTLLHNPGQLSVLRADPQRWPVVVEELLRHLSVVHSGVRRVATEDVEVAGTRIRAGDGVVVALQAANRDPDAFADPDRFEIDRNARQHLAFGHGAHQCVGQALARLELQIGLPALFDRLPSLRLADSPDEHVLQQSAVHGLGSLPVAW